MLGITDTSDEQIVIRPAVKFSEERGVYLAPVRWTAQVMMFCITPKRLQQELTEAIMTRSDIADVFDPETYRKLTGKGVYIDYYGYTPLKLGKSGLAYRSGIGICYVTEMGERYTHTDFIRLCNGEEAVADRLFNLCDWQAPETLLEDELHEETMQLPLLKFTPSLKTSWLTFHPNGPVPDEAKQALLQQSGWTENLSRVWTHPEQTPVPYGIAYISVEAPRTFNIAPTPDGCRTMKQLFEQNIETFQQKLQSLDRLIPLTQDSPFTADVHALLEEMVAEKRATIEDALESFAESIADLERCGY